MKMPSLGKFEQFFPDSRNIIRFLEQLDQYSEANCVPKDSSESQKRRAILISVIGAKVYDVLSDLSSPAVPKEKSYDQLATILRDHYAPKKLVIAERYRFHNCTQRGGESVSTFAAILKRLATQDLHWPSCPCLRKNHCKCAIPGSTLDLATLCGGKNWPFSHRERLGEPHQTRLE